MTRYAAETTVASDRSRAENVRNAKRPALMMRAGLVRRRDRVTRR